MIRGLSFAPQTPAARSDAARADVAVFVGLARRRAGALSAEQLLALRDAGWISVNTSPPLTDADWTPRFGRSREAVQALRDLPVAFASIDEFDAVFESTRDDGYATPLAVAVRAFFAEGGRRAWVVRSGDPVAVNAPRPAGLLAALIPVGGTVSAAERASWRGLAHVLGLEDAAMLLLPDLAEWFARPVTAVEDLPAPPPVWTPVFVECTEGDAVAAPVSDLQAVTAPRVDEAGFVAWRDAVTAARALLERLRPDMQLIAALPLPDADLTQAAADYAGFLEAHWNAAAESLASTRLQLAWPWLATGVSTRLPGGLEAPDARLAGRIATTVLARGAHRTPAGTPMPLLRALTPPVPATTLLADRVSVFGTTPTGIALVSDVTTAASPGQRPANIRRVLGLIARAARSLGDAAVFESSGPALWRQLTLATERLLDAFWQAGALNGATARDAYSVECGATTMSQADLDAGRVIVRIAVVPAASVERIEVSLVLTQGGVVNDGGVLNGGVPLGEAA